MELVKLKVLKDHGIGRYYRAGEIAERSEADAAELVRSGLAEKMADAAIENKAKQSAPENKKR